MMTLTTLFILQILVPAGYTVCDGKLVPCRHFVTDRWVTIARGEEKQLDSWGKQWLDKGAMEYKIQ